MLAVVFEVYNLVRDEIKFGAIFVNYNIIAQFVLAIYGVVISIYFKSKSGSIARLIWWIPQTIAISKVNYSLLNVSKGDPIFDLSLLLNLGFSTGFNDEYEIYTLIQINVLAAIGILLILFERERVNINSKRLP
jgi:hypothetical protein